MEDLIDLANEMDEYCKRNTHLDEDYIKEIKKYEMYMRKAFIMQRGFVALRHNDMTPDEMIRTTTAALIRDQKYVKQRDSMDAYQI